MRASFPPQEDFLHFVRYITCVMAAFHRLTQEILAVKVGAFSGKTS